jgi:hypothetical protein
MATRQLDKMRAIELPGGYVLGERGLDVHGTPTLAQHEAAGLFIDRVNRAGGWWKVDWIAYADTRPEWRAEMEESIPPATRRQYRYIGKAFPLDKRIDGVEFAHHAAVVNFEPELRDRVLKTAAREGWTSRETLHAAKTAAKTTETLAEGGADTVHHVEVLVLCALEGESAGQAEQAAWDALKKLLKAAAAELPFLSVKVIASHARPTIEEP